MFVVTTDYLCDYFVGIYESEEAAIEGLYNFIYTEGLTIIDKPSKDTYVAEDFLGEYTFYITKNVRMNKTYTVGFGGAYV